MSRRSGLSPLVGEAGRDPHLRAEIALAWGSRPLPGTWPPYIGISGAAAFFARLVLRFAAFRLAFRFVFAFFAFFVFLVFRAADFAPALRTVRFFARFVFFFFAVIGM
jgi:hypothetical protein